MAAVRPARRCPSPKAGLMRKPASTTAASSMSLSSRTARCWSATTPLAPSIASPTRASEPPRRPAVHGGLAPFEDSCMSMVFKRRLSLALALLLGSACLPALAADLTAAKATAKMCAACHCIDGIAKGADAPHLAGNGELYLARQLQSFRSDERQHPHMSGNDSGLTEEHLKSVL